jgi:hypothetical protein
MMLPIRLEEGTLVYVYDDKGQGRAKRVGRSDRRLTGGVVSPHVSSRSRFPS